MESKTMVIFIWDHMLIGGIETYIYKSIKYLREQGINCIWVKSKYAKVAEEFYEELDRPEIIKINRKKSIDKLDWSIIPSNIQRIEVITFDIGMFGEAEKLKMTLRKKLEVDTFLFIPHFTGGTIFLEDAYKGKAVCTVQNKMSNIIAKMIQNNNIFCFSKKHIERLVESYGKVKWGNLLPNLVPAIPENYSFDEENCIKLFERSHLRFNILAVTRFEFPHKGFLIGLIHTFARLKKEFVQITLTIIGYGDDETVKKTIAFYPKDITDSITLIGKVSPNKLKDYYRDANLNIGLAGGCSQGAKWGALSIPARHYSYTCEVYGYYPKAKEFIISSAPGKPLEKYIREILKMDKATYLKKCLDLSLIHISEPTRP